MHASLFLAALLGATAAPSLKRGLSTPHSPAAAPLFCADLAAAATSITWTYDWQLQPSDASCPELSRIGFAPMVWGANAASNISGSIFTNAATTHLLAFNEPNAKAQSDLTPAQAAALWPAVAAAAKAHNLSIVAPVPSGTDTAWLDAFFTACSCAADVKVIAMHPYDCDAAGLHGALNAFARFGKPIWVSEFNCGDGMKNASASEHMAWMKVALPILEADKRVER